MQLAEYQPLANMQLTALVCHPALARGGLRPNSGGSSRSYGRLAYMPLCEYVLPLLGITVGYGRGQVAS
jgi:hypothetical protein